MDTINIDGVEYDLSAATASAQEQIKNIAFVDEQLMQLNNELQVALTAKLGYTLALKRELAQIDT